MTHTIFTAWLFAAMLSQVPATRYGERVPVTEQRYAYEDPEARKARYRAFASDLATVIEEDGALPMMTRRQTGALMLAIAIKESSLSRDVDLGAGRHGVGDNGRSWCSMQIQAGLEKDGGTVPSVHPVVKTWTGRDLVRDRTKCFRAARQILKAAMGFCKDQKGPDKLSAYTTGTCQDDEAKAHHRWDLAIKLLRRPVPTEAEATALLDGAPKPAPAGQPPAPAARAEGPSKVAEAPLGSHPSARPAPAGTWGLCTGPSPTRDARTQSIRGDRAPPHENGDAT